MSERNLCKRKQERKRNANENKNLTSGHEPCNRCNTARSTSWLFVLAVYFDKPSRSNIDIACLRSSVLRCKTELFTKMLDIFPCAGYYE